MYDVIILGSGPAGMTAAIYALRAELHTLLIEKAPMSGGQVINTYEVDNYPGYKGISGFELSMKFRSHCDQLGVEVVIGEVTGIDVDTTIKKVVLKDGTCYETRSIIIATGATWRKLEVAGEEEFSGQGVSYCATCDGAFFREKEVAVVGGGDVAVEDAIFLARLCKKVYVIHRRDEFRAAKVLVTKLKTLENVEIIWDTVVEQISGTELVESIEIKNTKTQERLSKKVSGVFIAIGMIPNTDFIKGSVATDQGGYLIADELCETNVSGVFAVGDVRTKTLRQIITAAADGANAITAVERYFNNI